MSKISFNEEMNFEYLVASEVAPNVRRMVANNGNAMTFKGTNTYIVGNGKVALIDPGPELIDHRDALLEELQGETISHILLTHTHSDHSAGIDALQEVTGATLVGFGQRDQTLRPKEEEDEGEYIDWDFSPDICLKDGDTLEGESWKIDAVHTPGHAPDHLCFALSDQKVLFSGDHVMGWNTSIVAPPEGHMGDYMASLEKLFKREDEIYFPGHGGRILRPQRVVRAYLVHRSLREASVMNCVRDGKQKVSDIVDAVYPESVDGPKGFRGACTLSVLGHLEFLTEKGMVVSSKPNERPTASAEFEPA